MNVLRRVMTLVTGLALLAVHAGAQEPEAAQRLTVVQGAHARLVFARDVQRVAVGDPEVLGTIEISTRELLVLGKGPGQTTLLVWFADGHEEKLVTVRRDLSLLRDALREVHPGISVEVAPDRDAVVLRGLVPDVHTHVAAERAAQQYLDSGPGPIVRGGREGGAAESAPGVQVTVGPPREQAARRTAVINLLRVESLTSLEDRLAAAVNPIAGPSLFVRRLMLGQSPNDELDLFVLEGSVHDGPTLGRVLKLASRLVPAERLENLLRIDPTTPAPAGAGLAAYSLEDRVMAALQTVPGARITARRLSRGQVPDDAQDAFVLEGVVPDQVALVRALTLASQVLGDEGDVDDANDIRVLADEAGALRGRQGGQGQGGGGGVGGGGGGSGGGGQGGGFGGGQGGQGGNLMNQLQRNVGRAKALSAASGRLISFVEVRDLPQVRVQIRFFEVNRTLLETFDIDAAVLGADFAPGSLTPPGSVTALEGAGATRVGAVSPQDVRGVLSFLNGGLGQDVQFVDRRFSLQAALNILETQGVARSISSPTLTVLSGEMATFTAGGEIPVPIAFQPALGGGTPTNLGVFNAIEFRAFGVQLSVRALVGDDDAITLDLQPQVIQPDPALTSSIRDTTGQAQQTTAFQTRSLRTSARLQDGQALLIGGLVTQERTTNSDHVPFLHRVPLLEYLFEDKRAARNEFELIVLVNPVIVRDPVWNASLWTFPGALELMRALPLRGVEGRESPGKPAGGGTYGLDAIEGPATTTEPVRQPEGPAPQPEKPALQPDAEEPSRPLRRVG